MTAEEYLKEKKLNFNHVFKNGQKFTANLMEQYAKLKVSEACKKQKENCADMILDNPPITRLFGEDTANFKGMLAGAVLNAPEPEGENG